MAHLESALRLGCILIACAISAPGFALSGSKFHAGDRVFAIRGGLAVRSGASLSGAVIGTQAGAFPGTILGGPVVADGHDPWMAEVLPAWLQEINR